MDFDKDTWTIIDSYFRDNKNYLVKHHLDSFNDFIGNKIPLILQQYNPQVHVKELIPETDLEKKRFASALRRRELSLILGGKMKPSEATELKSIFE